MPDRQFLAALLLSLLAHGLVASAPTWRLPFDEGPDVSPDPRLDARLVALAAPAATVRPAAAPKPAPRPVRHAAARPRPAPVAESPAPAIEPPAIDFPPADTSVAEPPPAASPAPLVSPPADEPRTDVTLPASGRIGYVVTRGEGGFLIGRAVHTWRRDGDAYAIEAVTETVGLAALFRPVRLRQISEGTIGRSGLAPREFRVERNGRVTESARFDWAQKRVTLMTGGGQQEAPLVSGTQDILSQVYQVGRQSLADGRMEMMIATGKKYDRYAFDAVGIETLSTPLGDLRTLHLRTPGVPGEQATEVWIALDHHDLPVRLRHLDRKGDVYYQTVEELEYDGVRLPER